MCFLGKSAGSIWVSLKFLISYVAVTEPAFFGVALPRFFYAEKRSGKVKDARLLMRFSLLMLAPQSQQALIICRRVYFKAKNTQ